LGRLLLLPPPLLLLLPPPLLLLLLTGPPPLRLPTWHPAGQGPGGAGRPLSSCG
jgi:hypothetical protein